MKTPKSPPTSPKIYFWLYSPSSIALEQGYINFKSEYDYEHDYWNIKSSCRDGADAAGFQHLDVVNIHSFACLFNESSPDIKQN